MRKPLDSSLDRLFESAAAGDGGGVHGLLVHGLGPLAGPWFERRSLAVPAAVREEARNATVAMLLAPPTVQLIRDAADSELVVLKGPEVAALYPPAGRRFSDIDVLARNASTLQERLLAAGFVEVDEEGYGQTIDHHHLHPLRAPNGLLKVEVHASPSWPLDVQSRPPLDEIFAAAGPSALGVDGVSAPARAQHALLLACHAWRHEPLHRLRDLLDVALLADGVEPGELEEIAHRWGVERVWQTTWDAVNGLFLGGPQRGPLRTWAAHLPHVRERTVFENHLQRWLAPYRGLPFGRAVQRTGRTFLEDVRPAAGETWRDKLTRTASGMMHPRTPADRRDPVGEPHGRA